MGPTYLKIVKKIHDSAYLTKISFLLFKRLLNNIFAMLKYTTVRI